MARHDSLEQRIADWNGNPEDYPWWEPSAELAEAMESGDSPEDTVFPDGTTRKELLAEFAYLEQKDYWKALPQEVVDYRDRLPRIFGEAEQGPYSITCTYQKADPTGNWGGPAMQLSTEDETLVISMTLLGRTRRELIRVRVAPRKLSDERLVDPPTTSDRERSL